MSLVNPVSRSAVEYSINGRKYALTGDPHTHTCYSHGTGSVRDNVLAARAKGIFEIGISDHGPGHLGFGVPRKRLVEQKAEIRALREEFPDMRIMFSVEANIVCGGNGLDVAPSEMGFFDYVCAGWHYGAVGGLRPAGVASTLVNLAHGGIDKASRKQLRRNTDDVVRALEQNDIAFLTHPGDKAPVDLLEVALACARTDTLVEINTSHMSLDAHDIRTMMLADVGFIISSDAHTPDRVGDFAAAARLIVDAGLDPERVVNLAVT